MFTKELFGRRLLEVRKQNNETQPDLAKAIGTVKSHISEMENGKMTTTIEKFALICEHYKVSADYLLGLSDNPEPR
jgi:transcriptional regulator with XRE-family HTH domain